MDKINFEITTPEGVVYKANDVESVSLPTASGEITILPHHIPLVSALVAGEARVIKNGQTDLLAVSGGFIEIQPNSKIIVLADTAERAENININRAEEARKKAEEIMKEKQKDDVDYARLASQIEKELVRLRVARKHHSTKGSFVIHSEEN